MIFYGGTGESSHKYFVKAPGDNTQRRVRAFVRQIVNRMYECMIFEIANERVIQQDDTYGIVHPSNSDDDEEEQRVGSHHFVGKYTINIHTTNGDGESRKAEVKWNYKNTLKEQSGNFNLHPDLLRVTYRESIKRHLDVDGNFEVMGFTQLRTEYDHDKSSFHAHT